MVLWLAVALASPVSAITFPATGIINTIVGSGVGDGGSAAAAIIDPRGLAIQQTVTGAQDILIADGSNNRLRLVSGTTGNISTVAGTGTGGFSGDGNLAASAQLRFPTDVIASPTGNIYVADTDNNRVRLISPLGVITTIAGNGAATSSGDGGAATQAGIWAPRGLALDISGNLYIAEFSGNRIRKVSPTGIITAVAGSGTWGSTGDGGSATDAQLANPSGVAVDSFGNVYVAEYNGSRIRRVTTTGSISTIAGDGYQGFSGDGGPAQSSRLKLPYRVRFDVSGNLVILDYGNNRVRRIQAVNGVVSGQGTITTIAGNGSAGNSGDGGSATAATFVYLNGLAVDSRNNVYTGVTTNQVPSPDNRVRVISAAGIITSLVGGGNGDGGAALQASIDPRGSSSAPSAPNLLYIADGNNNRVRVVDLSSGIISTVAGTGIAGYSGDGGSAANAQLKSPFDVARDDAGNVWIADTLNNRIRRVAANGSITTIAGNGSYGYGGDGGSATAGILAYPYGIAANSNGSAIYIADFANNRVRMVSGGIITTIAGNGNYGYAGDGGPATAAKLASPIDVVIGPDGLVYIADYSNNAVRRVRADGSIERVAGTGYAGYSGDGGPATAAQLSLPSGIAFDPAGNLLIGDAQNKRIRRVDAITGIISTIVGTGTGGSEGDGGAALSANLFRPTGLSIDSAGHLFISQSDNFRVRVTTLPTSTAQTGLSVNGSISYFSNGSPVSGVGLTLAPATSFATSLSARTDTNGNFEVDGAVNGTWTLTPRRNETNFSAITALDASVALETAVGIRNVSAAQRIACDVNGSGSVSAIDASLILQLRVGLIGDLPVSTTCQSDWAYFPSAQLSGSSSTTTPTIATSQCTPGSLTYSPLTSSVSGQSFTALLFGDCNGSWQPTGSGASYLASPRELRVGRPRHYGNIQLVPVILDTDRNIKAIELTLAYDPSHVSAPHVRRGPAAKKSMMQANPNTAGRIRVAMANPQSFAPGTLLWIRYTSDEAAGGELRVIHAVLSGD